MSLTPYSELGNEPAVFESDIIAQAEQQKKDAIASVEATDAQTSFFQALRSGAKVELPQIALRDWVQTHALDGIAYDANVNDKMSFSPVDQAISDGFTEDSAKDFALVRSDREYSQLKAMKMREAELNKQSDTLNMATKFALGFGDATNLIPGFKIAKTINKAANIAKGAVGVAASAGIGAAVSEGILQGVQNDRAISTSVSAIALSSALGGVLGAGVAGIHTNNRVKKDMAVINKLKETLPPQAASTGDMPDGIDLSIGSAEVDKRRVVEGDNTILSSVSSDAYLSLARGTTLNLRGHTNAIDFIREDVGGLTTTPMYLTKNFDADVANTKPTQLAAEDDIAYSMDKQVTPVISDYTKALDTYNKAAHSLRDRVLHPVRTRAEFDREVAMAISNGGVHENPIVADMAQSVTKNIFKPAYDEYVKLGIIPEGTKIENAMGYFPQLYNVDELAKHGSTFLNDLTVWQKGLSDFDNQKYIDTEKRKLAKSLEKLDLHNQDLNVAQQKLDATIAFGLKDAEDLVNAAAISQGRIDQLGTSVKDTKATEKSLLSEQNVKHDEIIKSLNSDAETTRKALTVVQVEKTKVELKTKQQADKINAKITALNKKLNSATTNEVADKVIKSIAEEQRKLNVVIAVGKDDIAKLLTSETLVKNQLNDVYTKLKEASKQHKEITTNISKQADEATAANLKEINKLKAEQFRLQRDSKTLLDKGAKELEEANMKVEELKAEIRRRQDLAQQHKGEIENLEYFKKNPQARYKAAEDNARDIYNFLVESKGQPDWAAFSSGQSGRTKTRAINIPQHLLMNRNINGEKVDFIDTNIIAVARHVQRMTSGDIALTKRFGTSRWEDMAEHYHEQRNLLLKDAQAKYAGNQEELDKAIAAINRNMDEGVDVMKALWVRVKGNFNGSTNNKYLDNAVQLIGQASFMRSMGGVSVTSLVDLPTHAVNYGFRRVFSSILKDMSNTTKAILGDAEAKMTREEFANDIRRAGVAKETINLLGTSNAYGLADSSQVGNASMRAVNNASKTFTKYTGITYLNDMSTRESVAHGSMLIAEATERHAAGLPLTKMDILNLNQSGIGEKMWKPIAAEIAEHGRTAATGQRILNLDSWNDQALAEHVGRVLHKHSRQSTIGGNIGDKPAFMGEWYGKLTMQFTAFVFNAQDKILIKGLQRQDASFLLGTLGSIFLGMQVADLKSVLAGRDIEQDIEKRVYNGLNMSGVVAMPMMINAYSRTFTGVGWNPYQDRDAPKMTVMRNSMRALGAPVGYLMDAAVAMNGIMDGTWEQEDINNWRMIAAFQNNPAFDGIFDLAEEEIGKATGAKQKKKRKVQQ